MQFSPQQDKALLAVNEWLKDPDSQLFRLFGYAGTGKTTLAKHLAQGVTGGVLFAAFTGKAAHVLQTKGCEGASTIHSLIYRPVDKSRKILEELEAKLAELKARDPDEQDLDEEARLLQALKAERENLRRPFFHLNLESPVREAALVVVDECFVRGTLVDTPLGPTPIERIQAGDLVYNGQGENAVVRTIRKKVHSAQSIIVGGVKITSSPEHRFFTQRGLVKARDLVVGDMLARTGEAVRLLRDGLLSKRTDISILQHDLLDALVAPVPRVQDTPVLPVREAEDGGEAAGLPSVRVSRGHCSESKNSPTVPVQTSPRPEKDQSDVAGNWAQAASYRREREGNPPPSEMAVGGARGGVGAGVRGEDGGEAPCVQDRHRQSILADSRGGRRGVALREDAAGAGSAEDGFPGFARVEGSTFLEQGSSGLAEFLDENGDLYLYDLQVDGHSSFSVAGVLVHNCSMVDTAMAHDLLSFGTKVLVLGDPAQLPPVAGGGYFTEHAPDFMLTEIHRQAADNPIIAMATRIRGARMPTYGQYGDSCVVSSFDMLMALEADQILVGKNVTRKKLNARIRTQLGRSSAEPEPGDRIVCLQNNHQEGLLNGALWEIQGVTKHKVSPDIASLHIKSEDTGANVEVDAFLHYFRGLEPAFHQRGYADHFDYGYALTCHKSQGSQWSNVLVLDESDSFRENKWRWLYTAVTRAADKVSVVVT